MRMATLPNWAASSMRRLRALPPRASGTWPCAQCQRTVRRETSSSKACHKSLFLTGLPALMRQPFCCHVQVQLITPLRRYSESVTTTTSLPTGVVARSSTAPISSILLLVV
jgi:hypothetical protein